MLTESHFTAAPNMAAEHLVEVRLLGITAEQWSQALDIFYQVAKGLLTPEQGTAEAHKLFGGGIWKKLLPVLQKILGGLGGAPAPTA